MPSTTGNLGLIKPNVNDPVDKDLWGGFLNTNLDTEDALARQQFPLALPTIDGAAHKLIYNNRYPLKIRSASIISETGTATLVLAINGTAIPVASGSAAVATTGNTSVYSATNTMAAGDVLTYQFTGASGCTYVALNVFYDQTGAASS